MSAIEYRAYEEMYAHCLVFCDKPEEALASSLRLGGNFGLPTDGAYLEMHKLVAKMRKDEEHDSEAFFGALGKVRWFRPAMNRDGSNGLLGRPFARSFAPLTQSLAPHCSF